MKKVLIIFLGLIGVLFAQSSHAAATSSVGACNANSFSGSYFDTQSYGVPNATEIFRFRTDDSFNLTQIKITGLVSQHDPNNVSLQVRLGTTTTLAVSDEIVVDYQTPIETQERTFDFSSFPVAATGTDYYVYLYTRLGGSLGYLYLASSTCEGISEAYVAALKYPRIEFIGDTFGNSIQFLFPPDGGSVNNFGQWKVRYVNNPTEGERVGGIAIEYGTSTNFLYRDYEPISEETGLHTKSIAKVDLNTPKLKVYYAQAYLLNRRVCDIFLDTCSPDIILATSSIISFTFLTKGTAEFPTNVFSIPWDTKVKQDTENTVCTSDVLDMVNIKDCIYLGLKTAGNFLFVPSDTTLQVMYDNVARLKQVFPFNIFFNFSDTAEAALEDTTLSDASITLPYLFKEGSFVVVSSSSLENFVGTDNKNMLFEAERNAIWIIVGALILFTII